MHSLKEKSGFRFRTQVYRAIFTFTLVLYHLIYNAETGEGSFNTIRHAGFGCVDLLVHAFSPDEAHPPKAVLTK